MNLLSRKVRSSLEEKCMWHLIWGMRVEITVWPRCTTVKRREFRKLDDFQGAAVEMLPTSVRSVTWSPGCGLSLVGSSGYA